jgi:bifunctional non-homologous end joining protein LigD
LSLGQRKALLWSVLDGPDRSEHLRYLDHVEGEGEEFFQATASLGIEGIVAKRKGSTYQAGARSRDWLKIKSVLSQEFVVGGYSEGQGARRDSFGALLLGCYEGDRLLYAGNVGSGFNERQLAELTGRLRHLETRACPFAEGPTPRPAVARWVGPELVAQVKFSQWTRDGRLRAPVFLGLRDDIDPRQVRREVAEPNVDAGIALARGDALPAIDQVLAQLDNDRDSVTLKLASHSLKLTNLNKELWPATSSHRAYTKRDLIRYYARVSPYILPHLRDRPLTLTRYPGGIASPSFYQKHWEHRLPPFVETVRLFSSTNKADVEYVLVNNLETLVWLAQLADIELHAWFSRIDPEPDATQLPTTFTGSKQAIETSVLNYPDFLIFDLDPYIYSGAEKPGEEPELNPRAFARVKKVAGRLRELLEGLSLKPYVKTSGRTGLHVYVPVLRQYDFDITRKACEAVGRFLVSSAPADVTVEWTVSKRTGKVFFDYNQNMRGKTVAAPYSLRPTPEATVSEPIAWEDLRDVYPTDFTIETAPARLERLNDLWSDILESKHDFRALVEGGEVTHNG